MDKNLEERISALEAKYAEQPAESEAAMELRKRREEAEEEALVKESLTLVDGSDEERRDVWRGHEAAKLSPEEAKTAFKQEREDGAWAGEMAGLAKTRGGR